MKTDKLLNVHLVSFTADPVGTLYVLWENSRRADDSAPKTVFDTRMLPGTPDREAAEKLFRTVLLQDLPLAENVSFTFLLENVPIRLREQMVRHRIGHKFGDQLAADIIPGLGDSTWWSQSMRVLDMGRFAAEGDYAVPRSMRESTEKILVNRRGLSVGPCDELSVDEFFREQMGWIQSAYNKFRAAGIPEEDCASILPLATTHRISWTLNLAALKHVLGKRGCWILQLGLWEPVIRGMIELLAASVDPLFRELVRPPCIDGEDRFTGCKYTLDNEKRTHGDDPLPPCSLWWHRHAADRSSLFDAAWVPLTVGGDPVNKDPVKTKQYTQMQQAYSGLWNRNARTGERLETA